MMLGIDLEPVRVNAHEAAGQVIVAPGSGWAVALSPRLAAAGLPPACRRWSGQAGTAGWPGGASTVQRHGRRGDSHRRGRNRGFGRLAHETVGMAAVAFIEHRLTAARMAPVSP